MSGGQRTVVVVVVGGGVDHEAPTGAGWSPPATIRRSLIAAQLLVAALEVHLPRELTEAEW